MRGNNITSGYIDKIVDNNLINISKTFSSLISNLQVNCGIIPINISRFASFMIKSIWDNKFLSLFPNSKNIS